MTKKFHFISLLILYSLLSGCGGGGSDGKLSVTSSPTAVLTYSPSVGVGSNVVIDASKSASPTGRSLTYEFKLVSAPAGYPGISYQDTTSIGFYTQYSGDYIYSVTASDGAQTSAPVIATINVCCDNSNTIAMASTFVSKFLNWTTSDIQAAYKAANPITLNDIFKFGATYQLSPYQLEYLSKATPGSYQTQIVTNSANSNFSALSGGATITGYSLNIPNTVQISGNLSAINYPSDYASSNSKTNSVSDPYCGLSDNTITFNTADIGAYTLPVINTVQLPASALRIAAMKDTWSINNPGYAQGCIKDMAAAVDKTMERLAVLNVNAMILTPWGIMQYNSDGSSVVIPAADISGSGMTDADITWYVQKAHSAGIKVIWLNQIQIALNPDGSNINNTSAANVTSAYAAIKTYLTSRGAALQAAGVDAIILGNWYWVNFENYQTPSESINSNIELIASLKNSFSGKVFLNIPSPAYINSTLNAAVDAYIFSGGFNYNQENIGSFTISNVKSQLQNTFNSYSSIIGLVPIIWDPSIQSRQGFFTTNPGYYDPFCTSSASSPCLQLNMVGDFSMQAIAIEAYMEFLGSHPNQNGGVIMSYARDSNLLPPAKFSNIDASVRGKPAEYIYYKWFNAR